jgi:hypothetical protein
MINHSISIFELMRVPKSPCVQNYQYFFFKVLSKDYTKILPSCAWARQPIMGVDQIRSIILTDVGE